MRNDKCENARVRIMCRMFCKHHANVVFAREALLSLTTYDFRMDLFHFRIKYLDFAVRHSRPV